MSDTAFAADLVLPASVPVESGGSYTNTQKFFQQFEGGIKPKVKPSFKQMIELLGIMGIKTKSGTIEDVLMERISSLPPQEEKEKKFSLIYTEDHNFARMFSHGCDFLHKKIR